MTGKDVFSLLLCSGYLKALEHFIEQENISILDEKVLKTFYRKLLMDYAAPIKDTAGSKAEELLHAPKEGYGIFTMLLMYTDWEILAGSFAYDLFTTISVEKEIYKCTAAQLGSGRVVLLDFLETESLKELSRIVRYAVFKLTKQDITGSNPLIEHSSIKAVRPLLDEWGMIIYR